MNAQHASEGVEYLTRALSTLSGCNRALLRADDETRCSRRFAGSSWMRPATAMRGWAKQNTTQRDGYTAGVRRIDQQHLDSLN